MSTDTTAGDAPPTTGPDAVDYTCYGHVRVRDDLLVYGREADDAWVQSDAFVDLESMR